MSEESKDLLDSGMKYEINRHIGQLLTKWLTLLGIANLSVLIAGAYYGITVLSDKTLEAAKKSADDKITFEIHKRTEDLDKDLKNLEQRIIRATSDIETRMDTINRMDGKIEGIGESVLNGLYKTQRELNRIEKDISAIEQSDVITLTNFLDSYQDSENLTGLINRIAEIENNYTKNSDISNYLKQDDAKREFDAIKNKIRRMETKAQSFVYESGIAATPPKGDTTKAAVVKFQTPFEKIPKIFVNVIGENSDYSGYPIVFNITKDGFSCVIKDQTGANTFRDKYDTSFNYMAIAVTD